MKLTKDGIEQLAKEVRKWASTNKMGCDWSLFYNGKMFSHPVTKGRDGNYRITHKTEHNINPHKYCELFSEKFIMGMSYDEFMDACFYYQGRCVKMRAYEKLKAIVNKYGLHIELRDPRHCEFVWNGDDIDGNVEYTYFPKKKDYTSLSSRTVLVDVEYKFLREYSFEITDEEYRKLICGDVYAGDDPEIDLAHKAFCRLRKEIGVPSGTIADESDYCMYTADGETIVAWTE